MAEGDMISMSQRELVRLHAVRKVLDKKTTQKEAGEAIGIGKRQMIRIVERVRKEGDRGIIHKSRGKRSNRAKPEWFKDKVVKLYKEKYWDFGPLLASEKLAEIDNIYLSDETLRQWLLENGDWKKKRKRKKNRKWRERKQHFGSMIQLDGSHHDWFEGRGEKSVLMGYIDDARSEVFARFYEYEGTMPAMDSFKKYAEKYGLPQMVYLDKHATYRSQKKATQEEELRNEKALSQFERAMKELGVNVKHAHSPQAKGRIERLFRTFQDRVIKEMRLAGVRTIKEGNKFLKWYLPKYNKRFNVEAVKKDNMHREIPANIDLGRILCKKTKRVVRNDNTVSYNTKLYQIEEYVGAKKQVVVEENAKGRIIIAQSEKKLKCKEIKNLPKKAYKKKLLKRPKKEYKPAEEHPWKKASYDGRIRRNKMREAVCC